MRNDGYRTKHGRGSSPSIQELGQEADNRGVDSIQSSGQIRDDESSSDKKKQVPDQEPYAESQGATRHMAGESR